MDQRLDDFIALSVALTGFGRLQLLGTGVGPEYLRVLDSIVPDGIVSALLREGASLPPGDDAATARLLDDAVLGPVARNIIVMWYSGTWNALPERWREANGRAAGDVSRVISAAAYLAGLQWAAAGAHPAGASPGGFGSWSSPPSGGES